MATRKTTSTKPKATRTKTNKTKETKPVVRTGTWVTLLVLVAVIAGALLINRNSEATAEAEITPTEAETFVFDSGALVTSIEVRSLTADPVKIERNAENAWVLSQPDEAEADPALAEAAATQISALKIVSEIEGDASIFGFDEPTYTINIEFDNGEKHSLEVGDSTPTNSGYYVRLDETKMLILSLSSIDALTTLAAFPPYLFTPTPPATATPLLPTETPASTPEASPTP
jgi:hypothetical protein